MFVVNEQDCRHQETASIGDPPASRPWDLRDETVEVKPLEHARDLGTLPAMLLRVTHAGKDCTADVLVAEAGDGVLTT